LSFEVDEFKTGDAPEVLAVPGKQWQFLHQSDSGDQAVCHPDRLAASVQLPPDTSCSLGRIAVQRQRAYRAKQLADGVAPLSLTRAAVQSK
jgi:hypothetical protein